MKKLAVVIAVALVAAGVAFFVTRRDTGEKSYRTERVTRGEIEEAVTATGTVNAVTTVLVGTQVSGTIRGIFADFNSPVTKGQVIAQIDPATFEAQVEQARANVMTARADLDRAEYQLTEAKRLYDRNRELFAKGFLSGSDVDASETVYLSAKAQAAAASARVSQAAAAFSVAETNLRYTRIISPVDGIIISRNVDVGQTVAASFQTPTLFTIAQDLTKMQVNLSVDEADIGRVKIGQDVLFRVDAYPERSFHGRVSQVRNAPITVQNVVTYDVIVTVGNADLSLKPGMTANASARISVRQDALKVPNAALRFRPPGKDRDAPPQKGTGVWVTGKDGLRRIPVSVGITDGTSSEVLSGDLTEGSEVVVDVISKQQPRTPSPGPRMF